MAFVVATAVRHSRQVCNVDAPAAFLAGLEDYLPAPMARLIAFDLVNLGSAPVGLTALLRGSPMSALTYHADSKLPFVALIITCTLIPDLFLYWLLVPKQYLLIRLGLSLAEIYAVILCLGIYGSMVARPHVLKAGYFVVRFGSFAEAALPLALIRNVEALPRARRSELRRRDPSAGAAIICTGESAVVRVELAEPVRLDSLLKPGSSHTIWYVGSDRATELARVLASCGST